MKKIPCAPLPIDRELRNSALAKHGLHFRDIMLLDLVRRDDDKGIAVMTNTLGNQWPATVEALLAMDYLTCDENHNIALSSKGVQLMAAISQHVYKN